MPCLRYLLEEGFVPILVWFNQLCPWHCHVLRKHKCVTLCCLHAPFCYFEDAFKIQQFTVYLSSPTRVRTCVYDNLVCHPRVMTYYFILKLLFPSFGAAHIMPASSFGLSNDFILN